MILVWKGALRACDIGILEHLYRSVQFQKFGQFISLAMSFGRKTKSIFGHLSKVVSKYKRINSLLYSKTNPIRRRGYMEVPVGKFGLFLLRQSLCVGGVCILFLACSVDMPSQMF